MEEEVSRRFPQSLFYGILAAGVIPASWINLESRRCRRCGACWGGFLELFGGLHKRRVELTPMEQRRLGSLTRRYLSQGKCMYNPVALCSALAS